MTKKQEEYKEQLKYDLENGITVSELIARLQKLPQDLIVVNDCRYHEPISSVSETEVDYCFDEIITKKVVGIW